jgi:hypothetical protein
MPLYAGMDWTSYRKPHRQIFGCAIAAVSDLEALASVFGESRRMSGLPKEHIFHAYTDAPEIQLTLLQNLMQASDMTLRVGAAVYDSVDGVQESITRLTPDDLTHRIGIDLLREFLPVYPVTKLVSDSELGGRKQETRFKKDVRLLRDLGCFPHAPAIEVSSSKKSELIQLADLFVYNLGRSQRDALELPAMREFIKVIRKDSRNVIRKFSEF